MVRAAAIKLERASLRAGGCAPLGWLVAVPRPGWWPCPAPPGMPAKRRRLSKSSAEAPTAKAKAKAKSRGSAAAPPPPEPQQIQVAENGGPTNPELAKLASVSAPRWAHFQEMLTAIKGHVTMTGIAVAAPPDIVTEDDNGLTGMQAPFCEGEFYASITKHGVYKCAQSLFRHNLLFTAMPSVPYRAKAIKTLKEHYYSNGPNKYPGELVVAVGTGVLPRIDIDNVKRISPEEADFAFVEAIYDAVVQDDAAALAKWRLHLLSVSYTYQLIDNEDDVTWAAQQFRQDLTQEFTSLHHTTYQKMMSVVYLVKKRERVAGKTTVPEVVALYRQKLRLASSNADAFSDGFIDTSVTFYDRVLRDPDLAQLMQTCDELDNNPFDAWTKIQTIIGKASTPENISWCFFRHLRHVLPRRDPRRHRTSAASRESARIRREGRPGLASLQTWLAHLLAGVVGGPTGLASGRHERHALKHGVAPSVAG